MTDSRTPGNPPEDTPAARPAADTPGAALPSSAVVFVLVIAALTLLVCLLVAARALTLGVSGEWVWKYHESAGRGLTTEIGLPLGLFVAFLILVWYLATSEKALVGWDREILAVVLLVVAALLFQLASGSSIRSPTIDNLIPPLSSPLHSRWSAVPDACASATTNNLDCLLTR